MRHTKKIANDLFGDAWTIERRLFSDGDKRTVILYNVGWSSTCYVQVKVWVESADVWVEYYEGDVRRCREVMNFEEFDPDADPIQYVSPSH